jgi:hypothetical protein
LHAAAHRPVVCCTPRTPRCTAYHRARQGVAGLARLERWCVRAWQRIQPRLTRAPRGGPPLLRAQRPHCCCACKGYSSVWCIVSREYHSLAAVLCGSSSGAIMYVGSNVGQFRGSLYAQYICCYLYSLTRFGVHIIARCLTSFEVEYTDIPCPT